MMRQASRWTRREFSAAFASMVGLACLPEGGQLVHRAEGGVLSFAYVGSKIGGNAGVLGVFDTGDGDWKQLQTIEAEAPSHIELHPYLPVIYVLHAIEAWGHLPRGAVSAYSIAPETGLLALRNTRPLALSAIGPRHAAVSHDGRYLIVAAEAGGLYSVLPIAEDGSLMAPASVRKGLGRAEGGIVKTARPQYVLRPPQGQTIVTVDAGNEEMQAFHIEDSLLQLCHSLRIHPGAGASQVISSRDGESLYALSARDGSLSVHGFDSSTGQISAVKQYLQASGTGTGVMAMHPSGRFLLTAGTDRLAQELTVYDVDPRSGRLTVLRRERQDEPIRALVFSPDGQRIFRSGLSSGRVVQAEFDLRAGVIAGERSVVQADSASCLLLYSL